MNRKKIIILISVVFIMLIATLFVSYAFFSTQTYGNETSKKAVFNSQKIQVEFSDGTEKLISNQDMYFIPGATITKTFTIKNTGDVPVKFFINLSDVLVTKKSNGIVEESYFERPQDITYEIKSESNSLVEGTLPLYDTYLLADQTLAKGESKTYTLTINYLTSEENQIVDSGKIINARISISQNVLSYIVISDERITKNNGEPDFSEIADYVEPGDSTSGEIGMFSTEDDYGTSWYFRGAQSYNYVNFAGMCWRILRIDGHRNIKLILEDQYTTCDNENYTGAWDIEASDGTSISMNGSTPYRTGNFGYDGSTGKYKISYLNPVDSPDRAMVNAFKFFQTNTLANKISSNYAGKTINDFLKPGNWCLNSKAYSDGTGMTLLENSDYSSNFYYDSYVRLYGKTTKEPTLKCSVDTIETYADNTTPMYVGTLTADEIVYAGGKVYETNSNYYLVNDWQLNNSKYFCLLSPYNFSDNNDAVFSVGSDGKLYGHSVNNLFFAFRPSVTLSSNVVIVDGEGTLKKPYIISS